MPHSKCFPYRPHDYMYDPIFQTSGAVDHYKAAIVAEMASVKFQICPIFPNMFSDLPHYPRVQLVKRRTPAPMSYTEKRVNIRDFDPALHKKPDVLGADRCKFFCPVINLPSKDALPYPQTFTIEKYEKKVTRHKTNVPTETMYRESDAQTEPWEPPYVVVGKGDPEILKLEFLKWGSGLPAGMHEVKLIERARMKAAWEKEMKPDVGDPQSLELYLNYLEVMETDEWAFREQEIQEIQDLRLHLLEKMIAEVMENSKTRTETKMQSFIARIEAEKNEKIKKIRKQTSRELRKLENQMKGVRKRYQQPDIIDEFADTKSEYYAPLLRHGEHPKRWHYVIDEKLKKYKAQFACVESFCTFPKWLNQVTTMCQDKMYAQKDPTKLCMRETKWTAPVLKQLYEDLLQLRKVTDERPLSLRTRREIPEVPPVTPTIDSVSKNDEELYRAIVLLQKFIRGRATQMIIYEGRDNCKELIHELKYSVGLLKKQKEARTKEKTRVKLQQREESMQLNMVQKLKGALGKLQGNIVGSLLDFLNKELRRLLEERKAHAMCLIYERERCLREAAEAGRRQKELRRRREHDEMFKQIVKITQESVEVYLQDIITEGMDFGSKEEATEYIINLSNKIEKETDEAYAQTAKLSIDEQDEIISDLFLNFLVPEVDKQIVRERIDAKQKQNLKAIHDSIESKFENLPKIKRLEEKKEEPDIQDQIEKYLAYLTEDQNQLDIETEADDKTEQWLSKLDEERNDDKPDVINRLNEPLDTISELSE